MSSKQPAMDGEFGVVPTPHRKYPQVVQEPAAVLAASWGLNIGPPSLRVWHLRLLGCPTEKVFCPPNFAAKGAAQIVPYLKQLSESSGILEVALHMGV